MNVTTRKRSPESGPAKSVALTTSDDDIVTIRIKDMIVEVGLGPDSALDRASALGGSAGRVVVRVFPARNPMAGVNRVFTEFDPR